MAVLFGNGFAIALNRRFAGKARPQRTAPLRIGEPLERCFSRGARSQRGGIFGGAGAKAMGTHNGLPDEPAGG
jgi:hypothetical protein